VTSRLALLQGAQKALIALTQEQPAGLPPGGRRVAARRALLRALFWHQAAALVPDAAVPPPPPLDPDPFAPPPAGLLREVDLLGALHEHLQGDQDRRRRGAHYTAPGLVRAVVEAALAPLLARCSRAEDLLSLRVCDPAMGAGAFLLEACARLAERLLALPGGPSSPVEARSLVARRCLRGLDLDDLTVEVARSSLWLHVGDPALPLDFADKTLRRGDALAGRRLPFPGRIDAFLGNPPWVSYAGRAAQPLAPARRADYQRRFASFRGYRNLQGLFVERCAEGLAPGGRMGLVLPSSMAELAGYAPVRRAHDRCCRCDEGLPDVGEDAFEGVFQPSMVLLSTRIEGGDEEAPGGPWPLRRGDLDGETRALLARLGGPPLPAHLFGERGVQTGRGDRRHLRAEPDEGHPMALRAGSDIQAFRAGPASYHAAPEGLGGRLRSPGEWAAVKVLIRQTARYPVAARSDGLAFRNSLLAGFEDEAHPADFLVAYLNSAPIRWLHYLGNRDARAGMPQVKIGHLRALPAPPPGLVPRLAALGGELSRRNAGINGEEQARLDQAVAAAFGLSERELERIQRTPLAPGGRP
jgi:hypothetical protein